MAALVKHIAAQPGENNALDLAIHWRDGSTSHVRVPGRAGVSLRWTAEEDATILALFGRVATQVEIARALPERTWGSITQRVGEYGRARH
jgi:hypothetical protein